MSHPPPSGRRQAWPLLAALLSLAILGLIAWNLTSRPTVPPHSPGSAARVARQRPTAAASPGGATPAASQPHIPPQVQPPAQEPPTDFSRRPTLAARPSPPQLAALAKLRRQLPTVTVDFDPLSGAPCQIVATGRFLTNAAPNPEDENASVKAFLDAHADLFGHAASALRHARVTRQDVTVHNGMRTTVWQQEVDGIPLYNTLLQASVTRDGALITLGSLFLPDAVAATGLAAAPRAALVAQPPVDVQHAVALAAASLGDPLVPAQATAIAAAEGPERKQRFSAPPLSDTLAQLAWLPITATTSRLAWDVTLMSLKQRAMFRVLVDATTGAVLMRTSLTNEISNAGYRVYADAATLQPFDSPSPMSPGWSTPASTQPAAAARSLITTPALDSTASPDGWIDDGGTATYGNNVDAHLDPGNTNPAYGAGAHAVSATRSFDFPLDPALAPATYQNAAVTQLFYLCNWYHDKMYQLGFTESAGNFQQNNANRGGLGGDAVLADAQDGGGTNNANFSTPADGSPGRMQMYLFTGPTPARDGALDAEIVLHEATHGLSNRLVGGGAGISALQAAGLGEGWSDFYAMSLLSQPDDPVNGNYASGAYATYQFRGLTENYYYGIRRYPYSTDLTRNPLTLKDLDPAQASAHSGVPKSPAISSTANEVHNMGEVWCATLWDARANLITKLGAPTGNQMILQLVTAAMKLSPVNPTFLQARDAILQADLVNSGGSNKNELWTAFAKRGLGASASVPASSTTEGIVEAFDLPDNLRVSPNTILAFDGSLGGPFAPATQTYTLSNTGTASLEWTASPTPTWLELAPTSGTLAAGDSATVRASMALTASTLAAGSYAASAVFTDVTSGTPLTRHVALNVSQPRVVWFDLTNDPGWTRQGEWAFGKPTGGGGTLHGHPDPTSGATGANVFGVNLSGDYDTSTAGSPYYLTTGAIDLSNRTSCQLRFKRWLNTDWISYAKASIEVSNNGTSWTSVYQNPSGSETADSAWTTVTYDISAVADRHSTVYVRWGHQIVTASGIYAYSGWNLDDIEILGTPTILLSVGTPSATVTEGDPPVTGTLTVTPAPLGDLVVHLTSSDLMAASVPASVTLAAGQTTTTFPITILDDALLDGTQSTTLTATATGYPDGSNILVINDNETATLTLTAPATASEGAGLVPATVTLSTPPDRAVSVSLSSSDASVVQPPAVVILPAGMTSAAFTLAVLDDHKINGPHAATLTAHVANWTDGTAVIVLSDNETTDLTLNLAGPVIAGSAASGTLAISGTLPSPLTVALASDTPSRLTVPATVTIAAGSTTATFTMTAPDHLTPQGPQAVTITASAAGFTGASGSTSVLDNTAHHFVFATIPSPQHQNSPFSVTLTAKDSSNTTVTTYSGTPTLTATGASGTASLTPTSASGFVGGVWTGNVAISTLGNNLVLTATDLVGRTGASNPFNVTAPVDSFTELFDSSGTNDVSNQSFLFTPDNSDGFYAMLHTTASALPTDPAGGAALMMSDDTYVQVTPTGGVTVKLYGNSYSTFYVGSNGYVTLGSGDTSYTEGFATHFSKPRIAALFDDLYPVTGQVTWKQTTDRIAVTWLGVKEINTSSSNSFQIEMFFDGRIRITCLGIAASDGLIGLSRGLGIPSGFIESDFSGYPIHSLGIQAPATTTEGAPPVVGTLIATPAPPSDLVVSLTSTDLTEATVPATVTIPAGQTTASFAITVIDDPLLDGTQTATLVATAPGYPDGSTVIAVQDNETATLALTAPTTTREGVGTVPGTVTVSAAPASAITVNLTSSDPAELQVPATLVIAAGQTSAAFTITVVDDRRIDGTRNVTLTAHVANWTDGSAGISVQDNENTTLTLTLPTAVSESGTGTGTVTISGTLASALTVALASNTTTRLTVPAMAEIPAGSTTTSFTLSAPDNALTDGTQVVTLSASATGFTGTSGTTQVLDNDVHHYLVAPIASPQVRGGPFSVTLTAKDLNNLTMASYTGTPQLSASGSGGAVAITPPVTTGFVSGVWTGNVSLNTFDDNVVVTVNDGAGHMGASNPFTVGTGMLHHLAWSPIASPQAKNVPFAVTATAQDAGNNPVTTFSGTANLSGFIASPPASSIVITEVNPNTPDEVELMNVSTAPVSIAGWTILLYDYDTGGTSAKTFTIPAGVTCAAGQLFRLQEGGTAPGSFPLFYYGANLNWTTESSSPTAVLVRDAADNLVDFVCAAGLAAAGISSPVAIPAALWTGAQVAAPGDLTNDYARIGNLDDNSAADWTAAAPGLGTQNPGLTTPFAGGANPVTITPTDSTSFVNGVWSGNITVLQAAAQMQLRANDGAGHLGESTAFDVAGNPPAVATVAATAVTGTGASLNGTANANFATTTGSFDYGLTASYDTTVATTPASVTGTANTAVSAALDGLTPGTTYHFRCSGTNLYGTTHGNDLTFTTLSDNAALANLTLSAGPLSPAFASATTHYTASTPHGTAAATLTPTVASNAATVKINGAPVSSGSASGAINLTIGSNAIETVVTAQDGLTQRAYSLVVTRRTFYQDWAAGLGLGAAAMDPLGDYDGDGWNNLLEWAFATNPSLAVRGNLQLTDGGITAHGGPLTLVTPDGTGGATRLALFCRRKDAATVGLTYTVEFSTNLAAWSLSADAPTVIAQDSELEAVTVPFPAPAGGHAPGFFRVRVTSQ